MKLRQIYLYPDLVHYPKEITGKFRDQSRSLCNYLERQIRPLSFEAEGFMKLCVIGMPNPAAGSSVNSSGALLIEVAFDPGEYLSVPRDSLNEYFIGMLTAGFGKARELIPETKLLESIESFRAKGYLNEWTAKKKTFKSLGLKASLRCALTIDAFALSLVIERGSEIVFDKQILSTEPDEIVFESKFKDIVERDGELTVIDKFDDPIFHLTAERLK